MERGLIVLAGGKNVRMGRVKWLLPVGGQPVLGTIVDVLCGHVEDVVIVLPYGADERLRRQAVGAVGGGSVRWLQDEQPAGGPLAGLAVALKHSPCERNLVVAADMPFVRRDVAELLFRACERQGTDAAVPVSGGRMHPLFAVYHRRTLPSLLAYRDGSGRKVMDWLAALHVAKVEGEELKHADPDGAAFFNMNTEEDYYMARQMQK